MPRTEPVVIYETVHGSRAYGLAVDGSDTDHKGAVVGPAAWYLGFQAGPEQLELTKDHVRFEVRKLVRLAAAANPTALEILFTNPEHHLTVTAEGERLLDWRGNFLSRRVEGTFGGYALSQLGRIRTHRQWLLEPPAAAPTRANFGLPERSVVPRDQLGAVEAMLGDGRLGEADLTTNFLEVLERERRYRAARQTWGQYQGWLRHRNPKRAELEARYGYDTKHALHLVRLLRMGVELLETGEVRVTRDDRDELLAIRAGAWSYDRLLEAAEGLRARMREAAAHSPLPETCDEEAANTLCADVVAAVLERCP